MSGWEALSDGIRHRQFICRIHDQMQLVTEPPDNFLPQRAIFLLASIRLTAVVCIGVSASVRLPVRVLALGKRRNRFAVDRQMLPKLRQRFE